MNEQVILLVEDNPDDVLLTRRALKNSNIRNEVVVANDGQEALDWLFRAGKFAQRNPRVIPAVILLDLKLPKISGLEVLERIRADERTQMYPIVILTSSLEEQDLVRGYSLHANSYIRKPVDFTKFAVAVQQLGIYWLVLNEPPLGRKCVSNGDAA